MKELKKFAKAIWSDESGQGATEYILLLVVVVGLVMLFGPRIKGMVGEKLSDLAGGMGSIVPTGE